MQGSAARSKCAACTKSHKHCDLSKPCFACRLSGSKCKYERPPESRPLPDLVDRLESLAERLCDTGDAEYSSDDDTDDRSNVLDPEFGVKRLRVNPMEDSIYTSHPARETNCPGYHEMLSKYTSTKHTAEIREIIANMYVEFTQLGFSLYPLNKPLAPPQNVDIESYISKVVACLRDEHQLMDQFLRQLLPLSEFGDFTKFSPEDKGPRGAMYYGAIAFVLTRHIYKHDFLNSELQQVLRWATVNAAKLCFQTAIYPASIDALRAILIVFCSNSDHWLGADALNQLSRIAMGMCRDLGLNRDYIYLRLPRKQRLEWNILFWISYFTNRSLSIRWGWFPAVEANEISPVAIELAACTEVMGIQQTIQLFRIYDEMYEFMSSPAAEARPARELVSKSLRYLGKLEKWWNRTYPLVGMGATNSVLDKIDEVYYDEIEVRVIARWTVGTFLYLRMSIFQSCAGSSIDLREHLSSMYPSDVAYLAENRSPASNLQSRIYSLLRPYKSLQKVALQGVILSTKSLPSQEVCIKNLFDAINFLSTMIKAVAETQSITTYELESCRALSSNASREFGGSQMRIVVELLAFIRNCAEVIETFGKLFYRDTEFLDNLELPFIERTVQTSKGASAPVQIASNGLPDPSLSEFLF